jgi:hypothetical protein
MEEHVRLRRRSSAIAAAAIAVAGIALFALITVSARYPLPILIGARRGPLFAGLTLAVALATAAVASEPSSRHARLTMQRTEGYGVLAWWIGIFAALAMLSYAAWKGWGVVAMFAALIALVKVLQVASLLKQDRSVRVWHPFAAIMALFLCLVGIGQFLARPNLPPPIQAAMTAYQGARAAQAPTTRPAPEVSATGLTFRESGDVDLGGLPATLFSYDDREGSRVDVYEADIGFPAPQGSVGVDDPPGWLLESYRLSLRTGPKGSNFLVVSWSTDVVNRIANALAARYSP